MNKSLYKVIFNKTKGLMVVVAENARGNGKKSCRKKITLNRGCEDTSSQASIFLSYSNALPFGLFCTISCLSVSAHSSNIRADSAAPHYQQAVILQTANGLPQVNIQTPSAAGVSVNQFKQFDVDNKGALLNNARESTQTQLAG